MHMHMFEGINAHTANLNQANNHVVHEMNQTAFQILFLNHIGGERKEKGGGKP